MRRRDSACPRQGLRSYTAVLRSPGVPAPALGAALAAVPIGMLGLALLLLVRAHGGSFTTAGVVVAALGVGTVVGMVAQGRLIDRIGPRPVLLAASTARAALAVAVVAAHGLPPWALAALAALLGASEPQAGPVLRTLWPSLVGPQLRTAATALSSALFELPVLAGPLLVAATVALFPVEIAVLGAAGFAVVGSWVVACSAAAGRRPGSARLGPARPALGPAAWAVIAVMAAQGLAVGSFQVGAAAATGSVPLLYAALTAGSLAGTVLYGIRSRPVASPRQVPLLLTGVAAVLASTAVLAATAGGQVLLACALAFGSLVGPLGVRCFLDLERHVPPAARAAAVTTAIAAGLAATSAGSAITGWLVDVADPARALAVGAAGTVGAAAALGVSAGLRRGCPRQPGRGGSGPSRPR